MGNKLTKTSNKVNGISSMEVLVITGAFVLIAVAVFMVTLKPATEDVAGIAIDNATDAVTG